MKRIFNYMVAVSLALSATPGLAQPYPSKPIRIVVPISAGSATDALVRAVSDKLSITLGQPVVIDNRPGAGTTIGANFVAKAPADGYTLLATSTAHTVSPWLYPSLPYDVEKDFVSVGTLAAIPNVLVASPKKGYKTASDFVREAMKRPGELNYASAGNGTSTHISGELFRLSSKIKATHVPYKGTPEAITATLSGDVDVFFAPMTAALPNIKAGKLVALAVCADKRSDSLPHVPTTIEAGFPDTALTVWIGLFAPKGTPPAVVNQLNKEIGAAIGAPEVRQRLASLGAEPLISSPKGLDDIVRKDLDMNRTLMTSAGVKLE